MNTNNNGYTIIYTALIVVVVAAVLAFVSQGLKSNQEANEQADVISQMMTAAGIDGKVKADFEAMGNANVLKMYSENIEKAYTFDAEGNQLPLGTADGQIEIYTPKMLKAIYRAAKNGEAHDALPVFVFKNGTTVLPVYGAGLWGPIWGYIAFEGQTIKGAYFDHESETAGLGARIKDDPDFQARFAGKRVFVEGADAPFEIAKAGAHKLGEDNGIDAIAGATMTSNGLNDAIVLWLNLYQPLFGGAPACEHSQEACEGKHEGGEGEHECGEEHACEEKHENCDKPCCQDETPKAEEE